ncbi:VanW family protein [Patescibacteria group bacterium]|nr:VanW family protein [Patescibacteria group bacterium]
MPKKIKQNPTHLFLVRINRLPVIFKILFGLIVLTLLLFLNYSLTYFDKIHPNTNVLGIDIGGKKIDEAANILSTSIESPKTQIIKLADKNYNIDLGAIGFSYDLEGTAKEAYYLHRTGNIALDTLGKVKALFTKSEITLSLNFDGEKLDELLNIFAGEVATPPQYPSAIYKNGQVEILPGKSGTRLNIDELKIALTSALSKNNREPFEFHLEVVDPTLKPEEETAYKERLTKFLGESLTLTFEFNNFIYEGPELFDFVSPYGGYNEGEIAKIISQIALAVNRNPQNSVFTFEDGRVKEFLPSKDGVSIKEKELKNKIIGNLTSLESETETNITFEIPVTKTIPEIDTSEVNSLGINELLGKGSSTFRGSIASRIHNIGVAASKFKGVLIKPGETVSFNQILGDVSAYTGYQQAYIIKDGQTVLGDGGGVCQVSTTLFRAILAAGLPIVERRAHSYRVGYYEQDSPPGLDATVYSPTTDLKFKNDTPAHLLIQSYYNPKALTLEFEIYGTNDGRAAEVTKPVTLSTTPPPEDLYIDDPTLPLGTVKQIDYKAWGAKVQFNYKVTKGGEVVYEKTFYSNYQPWQAKFLRGTGPAN